MFNRVNRRFFLKHGASSLLATSIWPALPIVSDATQGQGSQVRPTLGSQDGVPILAPPPINQFSKYELLERATYVSGRGEIENYFRNAAKPVGCEQNLGINCQLRARMTYKAIQELETYISAAQYGPIPRDVQETVLRARYVLGQIYSYLGNFEKAIEQFHADHELALSLGFNDQAFALEKILGITRFRSGQTENWVAHHNSLSSIFPLRPEAQFKEATHAEDAIKDFLQYLEHAPHDLEEKWLLNLSYMALGKYPGSVPRKHLIPFSAFESKDDIGRFVDVAPALGIAVFAMAGSVIIDDFDNDGYLDLMVSTGDHCEPLHFFHNNGDETFENRSAQAGLSELFGGFTIFQADYNNDGWLDLYVVRGAWETPVRHSLLRNNGDGTFTDLG